MRALYSAYPHMRICAEAAHDDVKLINYSLNVRETVTTSGRAHYDAEYGRSRSLWPLKAGPLKAGPHPFGQLTYSCTPGARQRTPGVVLHQYMS